MKLRPYQQEAVDETLKAFEGVNSVLIVMPTGTGKTVVFGHVIERRRRLASRTLVMAHREELLTQAQEKIHRITGIRPDLEMADWRAEDGFLQNPIVVTSVQTQVSGRGDARRMHRFDPAQFGLMVVDEAHHAPAASYRKVIEHYQANPELKMLGVTATPDRKDEQALGQIFDVVAYEYAMLDAIEDGWIVPIDQQLVAVEGLDFSECRKTAGDLNGVDLAKIMEFERVLHGIADPTVEIVGDRQALLFAASLAHAERLTEILNRHRPGSARIVTGTTPRPERREMLAAFKRRDFQYLVNVGVATEGFDIPGVEVVVMARPTLSRPLFSQMIGRGIRPEAALVDQFETAELRRAAIERSSKPSLLVLDFVGNSGRHKLIHTTDILGGEYDDEIVELAEREMVAEGKPRRVIDELVKAEIKHHKQKKEAEERLRRHIKGKARYSTQRVNPFDVLEISAPREPAWHKDRQPTEKQVAFLERNRIKNPEALTFCQASRLIDEIIGRRKKGLCTFRQAQVLQRHGYETKDLEFEAASVLISGLAKNNWRKPGAVYV